ncbi:MAG: metallophosphoesterase family protein [Gemmatimonadota bacterium]
MRVLHFSDLHIGLGLHRVPFFDWPGKRLAGGLNLLRGRSRHFADAARKALGLVDLDKRLAPDFVLCTGDLTALATHAEFEAARSLLEPLPDSPRFVVTPGNHDAYTRPTVREGRFRQYFEGGLRTDFPGLRTDGPWPVVRVPDDDVAIIAVDSARNNLLPWRASGRIPAAQIEGLRAALSDPRVAGRFVFLMTHYAPCRSDGSPDTREHGLRNVDAFLGAASSIERGALLCGHVHEMFRVEIAAFRGEVFCAGSATYRGREGVWLFDRDDRGVWTARRGRWTGEEYDVEAEGTPVAGQEPR